MGRLADMVVMVVGTLKPVAMVVGV